MDLEYVSIAKSRAGYAPKSAGKPTPKTSANSAAITNPDGGKSASKNEEA